MIKHVCDICGKDAVDDNFILPFNKRYYAVGNGTEISAFTNLEKDSMDLCVDCMKKIASLIDNMRV